MKKDIYETKFNIPAQALYHYKIKDRRLKNRLRSKVIFKSGVESNLNIYVKLL